MRFFFFLFLFFFTGVLRGSVEATRPLGVEIGRGGGRLDSRDWRWREGGDEGRKSLQYLKWKMESGGGGKMID